MDASKPFIYGINPRIIGEAGHSQNRPVSAVNDGICVYAATFADYGQLGGAIVVFDPASEKIEAYRNFVRHQNPLTLFHHRKTGMLVGTTSVNADNGTCSPKAKQAFVFVWDTRLRKTVFKTAPWKMSSIHACDLSEEGVLIGFDKERYFLFDAARRTMKVMEWRHGFISSGVFLNPSEFMGSSGDAVIVLDIAKNRLERKIKIKGMTIAERFSERQALAIKNGLSIHLLTI